MILLDTNVISEPWKPVPDGAVVAWMDAQVLETLFLSAITIAELRFGIAAMPLGKRQTILRDRLEGEVLPLFAERILPFGVATSQFYSSLWRALEYPGKRSARLTDILQPQQQRTALRSQRATPVLLRPLG
jgi:predicted nucleic acid-binding protein